MSHRGRALLVAVVAGLALMAFWVPGANAAAKPNPFYGIQAWTIPDGRAFGAMQKARLGTYRMFFFWSEIEANPGERNWGHLDKAVAAAARKQVSVLPVLHGTPSFRAAYGSSEHGAVPTNNAGRQAFAAFARDAAARYGPGGDFWRANPSLPRVAAVRRWQLWNEPNGSTLACAATTRKKCPPKGSPSAYGKLIKAAAAGIRSRDRGAKISLAGMAETVRGTPITTYLTNLYKIRNIKTSFDAVSLHPYAVDHRGVEGALKRARAVMNKKGDKRTPLWLTEVGWGTDKSSRYFSAGKKGQATRLKNTYSLVNRTRRRYNVAMVVWFSLQHTYEPANLGPRNRWQFHTGLFDLNGRANPSWKAIVRFSKGTAVSRINKAPQNAPNSNTDAQGGRGATEAPGGGGDPPQPAKPCTAPLPDGTCILP